MHKRHLPHLVDLMMSVPWCIYPGALEAMQTFVTQTEISDQERALIAESMHGSKAAEALAFRENTKRDDSRRMQMRDGVALISITGPIYRYASMFDDLSGGATTAVIAKDFQRALDDPMVQAILFIIDSPGGEGQGISELADMIFAARGSKPVGVYSEGMLASAALWIASAADVIGVEPTTWVGSIGTIISVIDPAKRPTPYIQFVSEDAPKKRPDPYSEAGRAYLQSLANRTNQEFVQSVMRNRGMTRDQVVAIEGAVLVGSDAIEAGLIDRLASEEDMIVVMRERAQQQREQQLGLTNAAHTHKETPMPGDAKGFWSGFWSGAKEQGLLDLPSPAVAQIAQDANTPAPDAAQNVAQNAEITRLRQQLEASRQAEATTFVNGLIKAHQLLPADRDNVHALYMQASADDLIHGPITLASGQTTRVALVKASQQGRAAHDLTKEQLDPKQNAQQILTNSQHTKTGEEAELDAVEQSARAYAARTNGIKRS